MNHFNKKKAITWLIVLAGLLVLAQSLAAQSSPTLLVSMTGEGAQHRFGHGVASAGDVNGDGHPDVIVGAYGYNVRTGRAYVYHGGPTIDATPELTLTGESVLDEFGWAVASAGDVNGDGYADVIVGADWNDAGDDDAGRAYIYHGGPDMDGVADVTLTGEADGDWFGSAVSSAGDVDDDGYADVIVGAIYAGEESEGCAYVYHGGPAMDATADLILAGQASDDTFGEAVASAGDVNGDGYPDLIVGASGNDSGAAFVYHGGPGMDATADLILAGETQNDAFGWAVAGAGDVNDDGYADVIVGATSAGGDGAGQVYIFFGGTAMDAVADLTLAGEATDDRFGWSVSAAGDVDGDGYADLIVGAPSAGAEGAGRAYLYLGGAAMDNLADAVIDGEAADDLFGESVASAGDVDGDGHDDVLTGAGGQDAGASNAGKAYVYSLIAPCSPLFGDLDCDCDVDIVDIMLVASRWNTSVGDDDYDPAYDLDDSGDIDIVDIMLVAVHWGEIC